MGTDVQNTFAQNDQAAPLSAPAAPSDAVPSAPTDASATPSDSAAPQKNPLDILEEILNEREKEAAAAKPAPVSTEPTPEELERQRLAAEEEKKKTEEVRQQMQAEVSTPQQKTRDDIRVQQANNLKSDNPFEIKQLEHKQV